MLNCILIDDDEDEIVIFKMALSELDFEVSCTGFTNCKIALEVLSQKKISPDYIFLDSNLSGTDGIECLGKIKAVPELSQIPVIIFSGLISDEKKKQYMDTGASECMVKAYSLPDLKHKLNTFFTENLRMQR